MQLTLSTYILFYLLIVVFVFFLIYWSFNYSVNEGECLSVALIAGIIYLACFYRGVANYYLSLAFDPTYAAYLQYTIIVTVLIISVSTLFVFFTGISLLTFGRSKHLKIFKDI